MSSQDSTKQILKSLVEKFGEKIGNAIFEKILKSDEQKINDLFRLINSNYGIITALCELYPKLASKWITEIGITFETDGENYKKIALLEESNIIEKIRGLRLELALNLESIKKNQSIPFDINKFKGRYRIWTQRYIDLMKPSDEQIKSIKWTLSLQDGGVRTIIDVIQSAIKLGIGAIGLVSIGNAVIIAFGFGNGFIANVIRFFLGIPTSMIINGVVLGFTCIYLATLKIDDKHIINMSLSVANSLCNEKEYAFDKH